MACLIDGRSPRNLAYMCTPLQGFKGEEKQKLSWKNELNFA